MSILYSMKEYHYDTRHWLQLFLKYGPFAKRSATFSHCMFSLYRQSNYSFSVFLEHYNADTWSVWVANKLHSAWLGLCDHGFIIIMLHCYS